MNIELTQHAGNPRTKNRDLMTKLWKCSHRSILGFYSRLHCSAFPRYQRILATIILLAVLTILVIYAIQSYAYNRELRLDTVWDGNVEDFTYPENVTFIVPNIVHFIRLGEAPLSFVEAVCMRAAWLQQQPESLMIHCDKCNATMESPLWYLIKDLPGLTLRYIQRPTEIFGVKLRYIEHTSDVVRAVVLMKHGGIYLDGDSYLVKNLDVYRRYEMSIGWYPGRSVGTQVLVAHKDARYLKLWYDSYRMYRPELWYWNAGDLPTKRFLSVRPDLVNRVPYDFGVNEALVDTLYMECNNKWRAHSAFHLLLRHRARMVPADFAKYGTLTLENIPNYDRNFGQMARLVLSGTTRLGASEVKTVDWFSKHPLEYSKHGCS
ncbi:hypothetical protein HPB47_010891 [Ixodes persulcatus]|uniref:Uncharacterized protein n=1 Tax=Ixodes persulcatus TaxID=34615 RepID=A0AC60NXZ0_IXOPE|nr:hypothetical protein HPB47_010891 [Ixodes persulcatus]